MPITTQSNTMRMAIGSKSMRMESIIATTKKAMRCSKSMEKWSHTTRMGLDSSTERDTTQRDTKSEKKMASKWLMIRMASK